MPDGPLLNGKQVLVRRLVDGQIDSQMVPIAVEGYPVTLLAEALGKTYSTVRKWVEQGVLPAPVWAEYHRSYRVYTRVEVVAIARALNEHSFQFSYLRPDMTESVNRIWAAVRAARTTSI